MPSRGTKSSLLRTTSVAVEGTGYGAILALLLVCYVALDKLLTVFVPQLPSL